MKRALLPLAAMAVLAAGALLLALPEPAGACGGPCPTTTTSTSTTSTTSSTTTTPEETTTTTSTPSSSTSFPPPLVQCHDEPVAHERTEADDNPTSCQPPTTPTFTG